MPVRILWDPASNILAFDGTPAPTAAHIPERACHRKTGRASSWTPVADMYETDAAVVLSIELPGIDKQSLHIVFEHGQLALQGIRPFQKQDGTVKIHRVERMYGEFQRNFHIPVPVDSQAITASYERGILNIVLPKQQRRNAEPIKIPITFTHDKGRKKE